MGPVSRFAQGKCLGKIEVNLSLNITTLILIPAATAALIWSFIRDKDKTITGLKIAKGTFLEIGGEILGLLFLVGLFFAAVPPGMIKGLLGGTNVLLSSIYGASIGTVTIMPAFVAFPMAASLMERGAHLIAVAAFITTLTMVGFATAHIEIEHFGKRFTLIRNVLSFAAAIAIALGMMVIL